MTFKTANLPIHDRLFITMRMLLCKHVRLPRLELGTSTLSVSRSNQLSYNRKSWRLGDSNSWPSECKSDALPTELNPLNANLTWARLCYFFGCIFERICLQLNKLLGRSIYTHSFEIYYAGVWLSLEYASKKVAKSIWDKMLGRVIYLTI